MGLYKFGAKDLCKHLEELGFVKDTSKGTSHLKYKISGKRKCPKDRRPFIIVILGRKMYDPHTCTSYIRQIKNLGVGDNEIKKYF